MRKHLDVRSNVRPAPHVAAVAAAALILALLLATAPAVLSPTPDGGVRLRVPVVAVRTTLVLHRYDTPPPWPHGNCFSLSRLSLQQRRALEQRQQRERDEARAARRSSNRSSKRRSPGPPPESYELQVLNMHSANFGHIVGELKIDTVEVERVGKQHCLIVDARIPRQWLLEVPCSSCTPASLRKDLRSPRYADHFRKASL